MKKNTLLPLIIAVVIATLSFLYNTFLFIGIPSPVNDDYQIYFMLCGGGETPGCFSIYTHVALGAAVSALTAWMPDINWYLGILLAMTFLSCVTLNTLACKAALFVDRNSPTWSIRAVATVLILLSVNITSLSDIQYTHVAVLSCCAGALVLGCAFFKRTAAHLPEIAAGCLLIALGTMLRTSALLPAIFLLAALLISWSVTYRRLAPNAVICSAAASLLVILLVLAAIQKACYSHEPDWDTAARYLHSRVNILDYPDNSGIDKSARYAEAGIAAEEITVFKSFTYVPSMDSLEKVQAAEAIHRTDRKGLFGSELAAYAGLLETQPEQFTQPFSALPNLTPYTPLVCVTCLFILMFNRESAKKTLPMLLATLCFIVTLILVGRCVARVLAPFLYAAAIWILICLPDSAPMLRARLIRWGSIAFCLCCFLFSMRHKRPSFSSSGGGEQQPWQYCASHPDTLFLTTCIQGCGLFPYGLGGYTHSYLKHTNIIPVADGWVFYTPAYRSALKARGITNPYLKLTEPNTRLVTFKRYKPAKMLQRISFLHEAATGTGLNFTLVRSCGQFDFWQAYPKEADMNTTH